MKSINLLGISGSPRLAFTDYVVKAALERQTKTNGTNRVQFNRLKINDQYCLSIVTVHDTVLNRSE